MYVGIITAKLRLNRIKINLNYMQNINLASKFTLCFCIKKSDAEKVRKMMSDNNYTASEYYKSGFNSFVEFRIQANICRAYAIKQLLKNIKVYD